MATGSILPATATLLLIINFNCIKLPLIKEKAAQWVAFSFDRDIHPKAYFSL